MNWHGVYAIDPGETTGVMWGAFPTKGSTISCLRRGRKIGAAQVAMSDALAKLSPEGYSKEQAMGFLLAKSYLAFRSMCKGRGVEASLVVEDFTLRGGQFTTKREGLTPVRIAMALEGSLFALAPELREEGELLYYQGAGLAKGYAKRERMERSGLWKATVGTRHARDAGRHIAYFLHSVVLS